MSAPDDADPPKVQGDPPGSLALFASGIGKNPSSNLKTWEKNPVKKSMNFLF